MAAGVRRCNVIPRMSISWTVVAIVITMTTQTAVSQSDPAFPLVNVPDSEANVGSTARKTYVTTIELVPVNPSNTFNPNTFTIAARPYYSTRSGLRGYINLDSVVGNTVSDSVVLVTYSVIYNLPILAQTPGINDAMIKSTIGDYVDIRAGIEVPGNPLTNFFVFAPTNNSFAFTGQSVCSQLTIPCNSSQTQCTETLDGMSVSCQSPCKHEYCYNNGTCAQDTPNVSPTCMCLSKADVWFLGERCYTMVALWMVILAVVGCFLLIVAAIVIACCFYAAKRRKKEKESQLFGVSNAKGFTNTAYINNEAKKPEPIETITRDGFQERSIDAAAAAAAARRRSRTPPSGYGESRRRRSRSPSYRRRRSRSYERRRSRRDSSRTRSNSSVSSYNDGGSFDDSSEVSQDEIQAVSAAPLASAAQRRSSASSSNSSETPVKGKASVTSKDDSDVNEIELDVRDHGTSPIRWVPTSQSPKPAPGKQLGRINIASRKGWMPSLGPQMFNLEDQDDHEVPVLPAAERGGLRPSPYIADTDI